MFIEQDIYTRANDEEVDILTSTEFGHYLDHTLLLPQATRRDCRRVCEEAKAHGFAAACILPAWVADAAEILEGTQVAVCTVVGFPHGNAPAQAKAAEAATAIADGANEIEMVINLSALKSGSDLLVIDELQSVLDTAGMGGAVVKVILECCLLTDDEKRRAAQFAAEAGAQFLSTGTGFAPGDLGATESDIRLLRAIVGDDLGVKAADIRTAADSLTRIEAGADRIGTASGILLLESFAPISR